MIDVALFGAGRIGRIHATNLAAQSGVQLKYVCDAMPAAAADLAQTLGAQVADIDTVFADTSIDAVAICSPTTTHSDLITRAAQAGKHIFCEKPVDLSAERAKACGAAVAAAGVACMIGFQRRFDPTFNEAKIRLDRGDIGNPEMLVITSRDPGAPPVEYIKQSGGIFRDMLIHDFDIFRWILCGDGDAAATLYATGSVLVDLAIDNGGNVEGIKAGEFRDVDPAISGRLLLSSINSMSRWHKPQGKLSASGVVEQFVDIVLGGLRHH